MGNHLVAWQQSVDQAALARINAVQDDVLSASWTLRFLVPSDYRWIHWAIASGPSLTRAQIVAPSLDVRRMNLEIVPRVAASNLLALLVPQVYMPLRPIELVASETIEAQTAEGGAGATQQNVIVALGPAERPPMPAGDIRRVRGTGTTTLAAFAWTSVTLTLDSSLDAGVYTIVGMHPISANAIAARILIPGQRFRPGVPALAGTEAAASAFGPADVSRFQGFAFGEFRSTEVPQVQFFASVADTVETVFLDLIRTGPLPASTA